MRHPLLLCLSLFACAWQGEPGGPAPPLQPAPAAPETAPASSGATRATTGPAPASTSAPTAGCRVKIEGVVKGQVYRGNPPPAPSQVRDPKYQKLYEEESHGDHYLSCEYKVRLNGALYLHEHYFNNTSLELDETHCTASIKKVEERVRSFTDNCTDIHAGEYWGYQLKPLKL